MRVKKAIAFEGPAIQYQGDDGYPAAYILPVIIAYGVDGKLYQLPNSFQATYDDDGFQILKVRFDLSSARSICDKIYARDYTINESLWVEVTEADMKDYLSAGYGWEG